MEAIIERLAAGGRSVVATRKFVSKGQGGTLYLVRRDRDGQFQTASALGSADRPNYSGISSADRSAVVAHIEGEFRQGGRVFAGEWVEAGRPADRHLGTTAVPTQWKTETVCSLTRGILADHAADRLPILADALEEAGCDWRELLDCLRTKNVWLGWENNHNLRSQVSLIVGE